MPLYTVRIFKSWGARSADRRWSNTYEAVSAATSPVGMRVFAQALADAERNIHCTDVQFLSAIVSTWAPDSQPYNPASFTTVELSGTGSRGNSTPPNDSALDTNVALMVKFTPPTGRSGKRFYRGCLLEADVKMGGDGQATFDPAGPLLVGTDFQDFALAIAPFLGSEEDPALALISADGTGLGGPRFIETISLGAVVTNRRNHRYFDRQSIGG